MNKHLSQSEFQTPEVTTGPLPASKKVYIQSDRFADVKVPIRSAGNIISPGRVVFGADDGTLLCLLCTSKSVSQKGWARYMG